MKLLLVSICLMLIGCLPEPIAGFKSFETPDYSERVTYFDKEYKILYISKDEIINKDYIEIPIGSRFIIKDDICWMYRKALFHGYSFRAIVNVTFIFKFELNGVYYESAEMKMSETESLIWRSVFPLLYNNIQYRD